MNALYHRDAFSYHNGAAFTTWDQDHDTYVGGNCATNPVTGMSNGGMAPGPNWFKNCYNDQFLMGKNPFWGKFRSMFVYRVEGFGMKNEGRGMNSER